MTYNNSSSVDFSLDQQIIHHLMLKSGFLKDVGLLHGKMGIAILFYHYSKYTGNEVYEDFASDLLDDICDNLHKELPIGFDSGLAGVGWGIEYLIQNHFVKGNSNEICEELDHKVMNIDPRRMSPDFLETELPGILNYVLLRIKGATDQHNALPFDKTYINDLFQVVNSLDKKNKSPELIYEINQFTDFVAGIQLVNTSLDLKSFIEISSIKEKRMQSYPLGLKNGLAGYVYNQITRSEK